MQDAMTDHKAEWPAGVLNRETTLKLLREHNEWRRGASTPQTDPRMLGLALDAAITALTAAPAASEGEDGAVAWPVDCDWPAGNRFYVLDMQGEHEPCFLVMPCGGMLPLVHHARNGVDQARARFMAYACNNRPTDDEHWDRELSTRDLYHEIADKLAQGIADYFGRDIGEHSSANDPWMNALDVLAETRPAAQVAATPKHDDWYTTEQGTHHFDLDDDPKRQLSLMLKPDGSVMFAVYADGQRFNGDATAPIFREALTALCAPKHDEGREIVPVRSERRVDGGFYVVAGPYDNPRTHGEAVTAIRAALATQPAARRVADEEVSKACAAYTIALNNYGRDLQRKSAHEVAMRAALESFANGGDS